MAAGKGGSRKAATVEAVQRRRDSRRFVREAKEKKNSPQPMSASLVVGITSLTFREVKKLREIAQPLFDRGEVDLKYMSVMYLELVHLGWTQADLECRDDDFARVWAWWTDYLDPTERQIMITKSRFSRTVA